MSSFASFQNEIEQYSQVNLKAGYVKDPLVSKLAKVSVGKQAESFHGGKAVAVQSNESSTDSRTILVRVFTLPSKLY